MADTKPAVKAADVKPAAGTAADTEGALPGVAAEEKVVDTGSEHDKTDGQVVHEDNGAAKAREAVDPLVPPAPVPAVATVLYETPGGYQVVPEGVKPEQVGQNAIARA